MIPFIHAANYFRILPLLLWTLPPSVTKGKRQADANADEKVERRIVKGDLERNDFFSYILRHNTKGEISMEECKETAGILILAGSETTATFLVGALYLILRHLRTYDRLVKEVRGSFSSAADITL